MHQTLQQYLEDLVVDTQVPEAARELAQAALVQWHNGIVPHSKTLAEIDKLLTSARPDTCERMLSDGACTWLRIYGLRYKLPVPPQGERAMCPYPGDLARCPGYKRPR